jgi:hypothetical protein
LLPTNCTSPSWSHVVYLVSPPYFVKVVYSLLHETTVFEEIKVLVCLRER